MISKQPVKKTYININFIFYRYVTGMCVSREMPRLRCGHIPNITRSIPNARERRG
nr:MAG TPA: hypothetical protein [Caudoviricetes sp.]